MKINGTKRERVAEDGFIYTQDNEGPGGIKYFKCSKKSSRKCGGRGMLEDGVFSHTKSHNHAPDASAIERAVARAEMRQRAEETMEPVEEIRRSSEAGLSQCAREEMPLAGDVNRSINRYRARVHGARAQPRDAEELDVTGFTETTGRPGTPPGRFLLYDSQQDGEYRGKRMLLFASDWGLEQLSLHQNWAADGTFRVSPDVFSQLYTVHASVMGYAVPCAYILLDEKTEAAYRQMLRKLRTEIERIHPEFVSDGTIMTDMERAAMNAFEEIFPEKAQTVCFFHLCQAVWRKTRDCGLQAAYAEDADLALKVRNYISL